MEEQNKENEEIVELDNEIKTENINVPRETSINEMKVENTNVPRETFLLSSQ